jgi:hypothetical protein
VIHDVDAALRALLERDALQGTDVDVVFDAPTKEWASRRSAPTVDVYLYDVREDLRRRQVGRTDIRGADGIVTERRQPPRWFKLSYLVTAWTQRPEDEHRLLSRLIVAFLRLDVLPPDVISGDLGASGWPVGLTLAIPPPEDRALSDTWSAMGGDLKPSLDLVITAPVDLNRALHVGPPVLEETRLRLADEEVQRRRRRFESNGTDVDPPDGEPDPVVREVVAAGTGDGGRRVGLNERPRGGR